MHCAAGKLEEPLFTLNEFVLGNVDGAIATTNSGNAVGDAATDETAQGNYFPKLSTGGTLVRPRSALRMRHRICVANLRRGQRQVLPRRDCPFVPHLPCGDCGEELGPAAAPAAAAPLPPPLWPPFSDLFVCGDRADAPLLSHAMPNSLVTSDRFWLSRKQRTVLVDGNPDTVPSVHPAPLDQPGIYARHYGRDHCTSPY